MPRTLPVPSRLASPAIDKSVNTAVCGASQESLYTMYVPASPRSPARRDSLDRQALLDGQPSSSYPELLQPQPSSPHLRVSVEAYR